MARIRIDGLDQLQARLKASGRKATTALAGPLNLEAEVIMTTAKERTPVDTGALVNSGVVQRPDIDRNKVTVEMGFGGVASAYALAVHEYPSKYNPPSWSGGANVPRPGGQGRTKFLSSAVEEAKAGFGNRVARHLDLWK